MKTIPLNIVSGQEELQTSDSYVPQPMHCLYIYNLIFFSKTGMMWCCNNADNTGYLPRIPYSGDSSVDADNFIHIKSEMIKELAGEKPLNYAKNCLTCRVLKPKAHKEVPPHFLINIITPINWAGRCDAKCVYCWIRSNDAVEYEGKGSPWTKRSLEIISHLRERNAIADNSEVFLSEGEITISPKKDLIYETLSGYRINALTNGFRFDPKLAQGISNGGKVTISLDAGTRETFYAVKGFDIFDQFMQNIRDYRKHGTVELKYVLMAGVNDNEEDIENALEFAKEINPARFTLSYDKLIMGRRSAFYGFMRFIVLAKKYGVTISLAGQDSLVKIPDIYEYSIQCLNKYGDYYKKRQEFLSDHFRKNFDVKTYEKDYDAHREFVFKYLIYDLVKCFAPQTRFCVVGKRAFSNSICNAVNEATGRMAIRTNHFDNLEEPVDFTEHADVYIFEWATLAVQPKKRTDVFGDKLLIVMQEYMYYFGTPTDYLKTLKNADKYLVDCIIEQYNITLIELQSLQQEVQKANDLNKNLIERAEKTQVRYARLVRNNTTLKEQIENLIKKAEKTQARYNRLVRNNSALDEQVENMQSSHAQEVKKLSAQIESLLKKAEQTQIRYTRVLNSNVSLNEDVQVLQQEVKKADELSKNLNQTIESLEKDVQTVEKRYDDLCKSKLGKIQVAVWNRRAKNKKK